MKVLILVTVFAFAKCIYAGDDGILTPISTSGLQGEPKIPNFILPRIKREVYDIVNQRVPSGLQSGEQQTVIVVPDRGGNGYRGAGGANNNGQNRGTRVVVSQVPEYGNNGNSKNNG